MATATTVAKRRKVVSHDEWVAARKQFLVKEKEFTRLRDELSRQRRELPWERVEKPYDFQGPQGKLTLADLFDGRSQLVIYHFMLGPGWAEGCPSCSYICRSFRWHGDSPGESRCDPGGGFACADRGDRGLQKAHGMALPLGVVVRQRFQLRLPGVGFTRRSEQRQGALQLRNDGVPQPGTSGAERLLQRCGRRSITPTQRMRAGSIFSSAPITSLTWCPKAATKLGSKHTMAWVRHHDKYSEGYFVDPRSRMGTPAECAGAVIVLLRRITTSNSARLFACRQRRAA